MFAGRMKEDFAKGLDTICMEKGVGVFLLDKFTDFSQGINGSQLIVDMHDTDQDGFRSNAFLQLSKGDLAMAVGLQVSYFKTFLFQGQKRLQNRRVFYLCGYQVPAPVLKIVGNALNGQVIAFCTPGSKDDFFR